MEKNHYTPILIGGCGRSGTTLLLSIISSHPKIYAIPEETNIFCREIISPNWFNSSYFRDISQEKTHWCEKTPKNIHFFKNLITYFNGDVKLIQIVRDGRDVILSEHPNKLGGYYISPERWIADVKEGIKFLEDPNVCTIHYEDLILNFKPTIEKICNFLGVQCTKEILNWNKFAKVRKHKAIAGEITKLYKTSIGKWKKPENKRRVKELFKFPEANNLLNKFGYLRLK